MFGLKRKKNDNEQDQAPEPTPGLEINAKPTELKFATEPTELAVDAKPAAPEPEPKLSRAERKAEKAQKKANRKAEKEAKKNKKKMPLPPVSAPAPIPAPRRPQHDAQGDEKKKASRKTIWVVVAVFGGFAAVTGALEILAVRGQVAFGEHYLGLIGQLRYIVPVALEGGTLVSAGLALWAMLSGDKYFWHRTWTTIFLAAAMYANYLGVLAAGWSLIGAVYTAGFSIAVLRFWHAILKRIRRDLEQPDSWLRFPLTRWVLSFKETWKAWKLSHTEKMTADAALYWVRHQAITADPEPVEDEQAVDVSAMTKKNAVLYAARVLGSYQPADVRQWLAERGVTVDNSYTAQLLRDESDTRQRELARALESNSN